jgi:phosphate transport system protein
MRESFHELLAAFERSTLANLDLAIATLADIADAVADPAVPTPASIDRNAQRLHDSIDEANQNLITTIALQAPVASDLRLLLVLMHIAHHTGLIANQFDLIVAQIMETDPEARDAFATGDKLTEMAHLAGSELSTAALAFKERDVPLAQRVAEDDQDLNRLNREVFNATVYGDCEPAAREVALRHVLIARSLERVGDNAVDIAEQVPFLTTGEYSAATDAQAKGPDTTSRD